MEQSSYENFSGSQLVTLYNSMAEQLGIPSVKRFSDAKVGVRRCEELRAKLSAAGTDPERNEPETREEQPPEAPTVEFPTQETVAINPPTPEVQPLVVAAPPAPVASPAKKEKKKEAAPSKSGEPTLLDRFGARAGTIQEKILRVLCERLNTNVPLPDLVEAGYGDKGAAAGAAAIAMVMKGVKKNITVKNLNLELRKTQNDKIQYIGLYEINAGAVAA